MKDRKKDRNYRLSTYEKNGRQVCTIEVQDRYGEWHDLSPDDPPESTEQLRGFIKELHNEKFFSSETRDDLLDFEDEDVFESV